MTGFDAWAAAAVRGARRQEDRLRGRRPDGRDARQHPQDARRRWPRPSGRSSCRRPNLVERLRVIKEPGEIEALQKAVDLGDAAFADVAQRVEPGWTEKQVAWEIEKYIREHGGDGLSFDTIVAGGPWGAMPHAYPRDRKLEKGEGVVIDMGFDVDGYMSDLTRTIFLGKPDDQFKKIYDIVLAAQLTAEEMVKPGMTGERMPHDRRTT